MVKYISILLGGALVLGACGSESTSAEATDIVTNVEPTTGGPEITFEKEVFDFGKVKQGEEINHVFKFKNTGDQPLQIIDAKGSCGCTVPDAPKELIAPGAVADLDVKVNTSNKRGQINVTVSVKTNAKSGTRKTLKIVGEVLTEE
ncbi:MAG: DUF1573 domain-containing protein [Flavobacteriales bacterium]